MRKILIFLFFITAVFGEDMKFKTDENLLHGSLENGLNYYIFKNQTPKNSAEIYMYVKAGSTNENDDEQGLAHFSEHMMFNGTKDFNKNELITKLESLGVKFGAELNGATSFDKTFYKIHIKNEGENIATALKVLRNMAFDGLFLQSDIDGEKGIIIEEERMRNGVGMRIFKQEIPYLFGKSIYSKRLPIGKMDIIKSATDEKLRNFYHKNYKPENISLICVGDFDEKVVKNLIKAEFSRDIKGAENLAPNRKIDFFNRFVLFNVYDNEIQNESVNIYFEDRFRGGIVDFESFKDNIKMQYIRRLIDLISERRNANNESFYKIGFDNSNLFNQKELNIFTKNVLNGDFKGATSDIFSIINGVRKFGFSKQDFDGAKSEFLSQNESFYAAKNTQNNSFYLHKIAQFLDDKSVILSNEDSYKFTKIALNEITLEDVNEKFRQITGNGGILVELISQKKLNEKESDYAKFLLAKPYDTQNLQKLPSALIDDSNLSVQKPISEKSENGINIFEFANGVKVAHKEISDKKDEIYISAFKKGGFSNFKNTKIARLAVMISNESGLGGFNNYETNIITANENFSLNKSLNDICVEYNSLSSKKDVPNALKAIFADIKNAKIDENATSRFRRVWIDENRKNMQNADFKFVKELNDFMWQNDPKKTYISENDVRNFTNRDLQKFLDENFKSAGFDFVIVGDISKNEVKKLAGKYIANLNGVQKRSEISDDGIRAISGRQNFKRKYLKENIAKTQIFLRNETKFSLKEAYILNALSEILNVKMRELVREENSLVYNISSGVKFKKLPYSEAVTVISFSSEPKNVDKIVQFLYSIFDELKTQKVNEKYLENFKKQKNVELAKNFQNPEFLQNMIKNSIILDEPFLNLEELEKLIQSINTDDIMRAAKVYLDTKNFLISTNTFEKMKF